MYSNGTQRSRFSSYPDFFSFILNRVMQVSKTDKILMLGTEVAFYLLVTLEYCFHYKNEEHFIQEH